MVDLSPHLLKIKTVFEQTCNAQLGFANSLSSIYVGVGQKYVPIKKAQQERLCEMSFVILFTAWEQFLESSFERLIVDASLATFKRRNRVLVTDLDTVHDLIRGSRNYIDWADSAGVRDRAKVFFKGGDPFESALSAVSDDLTKMRKIRNRCVHYSHHASEQYDKMIRQVYGSSKYITPGRLMLSIPPPGLSAVSGAINYVSVFKLYCDILLTALSQIVPEKPRKTAVR